jgi:hypothetical protein
MITKQQKHRSNSPFFSFILNYFQEKAFPIYLCALLTTFASVVVVAVAVVVALSSIDNIVQTSFVEIL